MTQEQAKILIKERWLKDGYTELQCDDFFSMSDIVIRDKKVFLIGVDWIDHFDIIDCPLLSHVITTKF